MCAHNGTHIDAPFHFIKGGKTVDSISLDTFVGMAYVAEYHGIVSADDATETLEKAKKQNPEAAKRILIKGKAEVSLEAAKVFAASNLSVEIAVKAIILLAFFLLIFIVADKKIVCLSVRYRCSLS